MVSRNCLWKKSIVGNSPNAYIYIYYTCMLYAMKCIPSHDSFWIGFNRREMLYSYKHHWLFNFASLWVPHFEQHPSSKHARFTFRWMVSKLRKAQAALPPPAHGPCLFTPEVIDLSNQSGSMSRPDPQLGNNLGQFIYHRITIRSTIWILMIIQ